MLRITVELLPKGHEEGKRCLGTMDIWNDATGDLETGNYKFRIFQWGTPKRVWKSGELKGFPRQKRGPWDLLYLVLLKSVATRNR
jgi:hypothetical protein